MDSERMGTTCARLTVFSDIRQDGVQDDKPRREKGEWQRTQQQIMNMSHSRTDQ